MLRKYLLIILVFLVVQNSASGQYYSTGQEPFSLRWQHIHTENFQLIFSKEYAIEANRIANILQSSIQYVEYTLNHSPKPITVIIHSNTASANGLVSWAPRRMELYPTIDHVPEPGDWLLHLSIHESRHVVQIDKLNQGITKILYYLFGEQATGAVLGLYLPLWFLEGDAVGSETALTKSGRGRKASFAETLHPVLVESENYSFDKASYGSYKDFVPNHYQFGYYFTAYLRAKYGKDIWHNVLHNVATKPYSITPFNQALKKQTGKNKMQLFESFKDSLRIAFHNQGRGKFSFDSVSFHQKYYTSYYSPVFINNKVYSIKTSLHDITQIVAIQNNSDKIIFTPGFINDYRIRGFENKLVWSEQMPDVRWQNYNYSVIKVLDLNSGKVTQIGHKSRYYSQSIYKNKMVISSLKHTESELLVYSLSEDKFMDTIAFENIHFVRPKLINEKEVLTVIHENDGQSIAIVDLPGKKINYLTEKTFYEVKDPFLVDSSLYFVSGEDGTNNLYTLNLQSGKKRKLTNARYGIDGAEYANGNIYFSNYRVNGYNLGKIHLKKALANNFHRNNEGFLFVDTLSAQEKGLVDTELVATNQYDIHDYSRLKHLFNIHSWGLMYYNLDDYTFNPGITFLGQNILSTSFINISYERDVAQNADHYRFDWSYRGFFPRIDNAITYSTFEGFYASHDHDILRYDIAQTSHDIDLSIPLNLTRSKFRRFLQPQIGHSFIHRAVEGIWADSVFSGNINSFNYALSASFKLKRAHQHIHPRLGFELRYQFKHTPLKGNNLGNIISIENTLYLPGLVQNQHLLLSGSYQQKNWTQYRYADIQSVARGYQNPLNKEIVKLSADYIFPLMYPDISLSSLSYIKRIYMNTFHDYSLATYPGRANVHLSSTGFDIIGNMHLLRFVIPMKLGLRTIYLHQKDKIRFEFLFKLDISSL